MTTLIPAPDANNEWRLNTPGAEGWTRTARPDAADKYFLVSADGHVQEPRDLWATRMDAKYADRLPGIIVAPSIKADVIDYDEYRTNERKEGAYLAAWSFVQKSAAGLAAMLLGGVLQLAGYTPGEEQTPETVFAIRALISFVPGVAFLVAAVVFSRFKLDEAEHARIRAELDARALATTEP